MFPRMILYCVVLIMVTKDSFAAPHKYNCTDPSAYATDHIQHFACTTNMTYNFVFKSNGTGLYLDMKVTMFSGDTFFLSSGTGNESRNIISLKGEQHSYAVTYFIPDESVVISTTLNKTMKGLRTFSGMFHEGCNATVSSSIPVFHFPAYVIGSKVVACYITIHASDAKENYAYASLDSVNLKGKSSLSITGKPAVFPAELKAGDAPEFDFIAGELQFALALDLSIANQSFTILLDSVYNNCSGMTEMPSVAAQTLLLPTANMSNYLLQRLNCRWVIRGPQNNVLGLEILGFSLAGSQDLLVITDGGRRDSPVVLQASPCDARQVTDLVYSTSSRYMWISLTISEYNTSDTFAARASVSAEGGHFYDEATNVHITEASKESVYLLEVKPEKQVLLSVKASLKSSASVEVVSDFYKNGAVLQKFSAGTEAYPLASLNNRLMLRAKGFTKEDTFTFNFTGVEPGCHSTTLGTRGFYSLSNTCSAFCTWAINPSNSSEYKEKFTLTLNHLDLDKDDTVSISSLSQPHKPVLLLNASFSALPPVEMSSIDGAYVTITRNKCVQANRTVASGSLSGVIGSSFAPKLMPGVAYSFKSPMFPNQYPLNSTRSWTFNGTGIGGYHLTFSSMDIAKNHTLNLGSGNQSVPLTGSVLPADIVLENSILHAEFAAPVHQGYATGYGFDALLMPLDMVKVIVKESGQVETPSFPALVNESKTMLWSIYVPNIEPKKMSVAVLFNVSHHKSAKAPGTLTVYDGNSVRSPVLGNVTGENLLSRSDTILVKLVTVGGNESGSALQLNFTTYRCNMSDTCNNSKICIHEDWRCNGINDCGDNSDEVDCGYHPTPSPSPTTPPPGPPSPSKGVSVAAFVVTVLLALVIGAVGALFVPVLVRRYRAYRYSRFSNVAVSE